MNQIYFYAQSHTAMRRLSFIASTATGLSACLTTVAHEIPQEVGGFLLYVAFGVGLDCWDGEEIIRIKRFYWRWVRRLPYSIIHGCGLVY